MKVFVEARRKWKKISLVDLEKMSHGNQHQV